jgi:hypothetical protein
VHGVLKTWLHHVGTLDRRSGRGYR